MALGYAVGSIAGVNLIVAGEDCKAVIEGGGAFDLGYAGSNSRGTEGKVFTEYFSGPAKPFAILFEYASISLMQAVVTAIRAAIAAPDTFVVSVHDDKTTINHHCVWNFDAAKFGPEFPAQRTNPVYVKNYRLHFYAASAV